MKKLFILLAILLPLSLGFVSCSSNDEPEKTELSESDLALLQGTWDVTKIEEYTLPGERKVMVKGDKLVVFQKLPSDVNFEEVESYTFKATGMVLILSNYYTDEVEATIEILSLSSSKGKVKVTDLAYGYGSYTMHLKKN